MSYIWNLFFHCFFLGRLLMCYFWMLVQEVANILANGIKMRDYTKGVENSIRQVELDSIQVNSCAIVICASPR